MTAQLVTVACLILVLALPGMLVGAAGGLRGWLLLGTAPVLTYGLIGIGSRLVPGLVPRWSLWVLIGMAAAVALIVFGVRLAAQRWYGRFQVHEPLTMPTVWGRVHHAGVAAGVLLAGAIGFAAMYRATDHFTAVHQFWDAMMHTNATRFIAETGQSDPTALRALAEPDVKTFFYPNGYHVLGATVLQITHSPVVELVNLHGGLYAGILSVSSVALVRVSNGRPALAGASAVIAAAVATLPFGLLFFGPLWPFGAALVMLPGFLALFLAMFRSQRLELVVLTALAAIGMAAVHPSAALAAGVFGVCYVGTRWVTRRAIPRADLISLVLLGILAVSYVIPQYLAATRAAATLDVSWPIIAPAGHALGSLLFLNYVSDPEWLLVGVMLVGVIAIRRLSGLRWLMVGGLIFAFLFVLAASYKGWLVRLLTDPWWNDAWRFAAIAAIPQIILIAHGIVVIRDTVLGWLARRAPRAGTVPFARVAALGLVIIALGVLTGGFYARINTQVIRNAYTNGPTVSDRERAAMTELRALVPPGAVVMNDPQDGSPWMWALDGVRPVFGYPFAGSAEYPLLGPDRVMLYEKFDELDTNQRLRDIVRNLNIQYVWVGAGFATPTSTRAPGFERLDAVRSLHSVYQNPDVRIYRVDLTSGT